MSYALYSMDKESITLGLGFLSTIFSGKVILNQGPG
jgi:hypothetical protein